MVNPRHLAHFEDASARNLLARASFVGERGNFASKFAIPVSPRRLLADLAELTKSLQVLAAEGFLIRDAPTFLVGDNSEAPEATGSGLMAHSEVVKEHGVVPAGDAS